MTTSAFHVIAGELTLPPEYSEDALALRFANEHAGDLRYVALWGRWLRWDGIRWNFDDTLHAFDLARDICRQAASECSGRQQTGLAKALTSAKTVAAVVTLARADRRIAARVDQWDADPWLLNTPGGVIDLQTGYMRPHQADDYMTKMTAVAPGGDCPIWRAHLHRIMNGDDALVAYLQRMAGYALTGSVSEHALFFGHGGGGNGKTVTVKALAAIWGDYHTTAPIETFQVSSIDRHPTELADLRGARLVTATETEEGRRWAESRIKMLTGGDQVKARFMRQDLFAYAPQFKLFIIGNHKPGLRSVDAAIKRRFHLLPFTVTLHADERILDFEDTLRKEWPGILQWAIEGCAAWQQEHLSPPPAVVSATADYLESQDAIGAWLEECCERDAPGFETRTALFNSWMTWATAASEFVGNRARFLDTLEARGFEPLKRTGERGFLGIRILPKDVPPHWSEKP